MSLLKHADSAANHDRWKKVPQAVGSQVASNNITLHGSVNIVHLQDPQECLEFVDSSQTTGAVQKCTDYYAHMHDRGLTLQA
jgi:hypothetical protein